MKKLIAQSFLAVAVIIFIPLWVPIAIMVAICLGLNWVLDNA